jgi:hypothetical protein
MTRLFTESGIELSSLFVASVGSAEWPTEALGCPEPGTFYDTADAPYSGLIYVLSDGSRSWEYHVNQDDTAVVRCSEIEIALGTVVNLGQQARLDEATKLTLMRRDFSTDTFEVRREMTPEDMDRLVDILRQTAILSSDASCTTIFRLDFLTSIGTTEVEFICEENYKAFDIYWDGLHGHAPIIGYIIGPYLTGDPIPTLPTATP